MSSAIESPDQPAGSSRARRFREFLARIRREIAEDDVPGNAAKLAYYAFLSLPPALMALFGAAGLVGSERFAAWMEGQAALVLPPAVTTSIIGPFVRDVVLQEAPGPFSLGIVLALWGASSVFAGLMVSLNAAFDVAENRSWLRRRVIALATMLLAVMLFLLAAAALLAGPALSRAAGLGTAGETAWALVQWPLAFAFMVTAFWLGYYFLPNRDQSGCKRELLEAAALAAVIWIAATAGFRVYIANFSSYTEAYGFLGAFIILLLWLYVTAMVVLVGGEIAADRQRSH